MKLKLTLKSRRPSIVYSSNGKSYRLMPGLNVLNLNEDDYNALAKALSITHKKDAEPPKDNNQDTENNIAAEQSSNDITNDEMVYNQPEHIEDDENLKCEDTKESPTLEDIFDSENAELDADNDNVEKSIDYSSMTYNELKSEYKKVTGKNCRLKRADVIAFLQEYNNNV